MPERGERGRNAALVLPAWGVETFAVRTRTRTRPGAAGGGDGGGGRERTDVKPSAAHTASFPTAAPGMPQGNIFHVQVWRLRLSEEVKGLGCSRDLSVGWPRRHPPRLPAAHGGFRDHRAQEWSGCLPAHPQSTAQASFLAWREPPPSRSKRSWTGKRIGTPPPCVGGFPAAPAVWFGLVGGVRGGLHYSSPWNIQAAGQSNEPVRDG